MTILPKMEQKPKQSVYIFLSQGMKVTAMSSGLEDGGKMMRRYIKRENVMVPESEEPP